MKKQFKFLLLVSVLVFAFLSCEKDKKKGGGGDDDPFEEPYSKLTPDENKQNVEATAVDMVNEMEDLSSSNAFKILIHMSELMGGEEESSEVIFAKMGLVPSKSPVSVFKSLKSTNEDPVSILEEWETIAARYTWNFDNEEFDSTGSDNLVIEFPGMEGDMTNTAVLTLHKPTVITISILMMNGLKILLLKLLQKLKLIWNMKVKKLYRMN
ncbi:MAG: hypothetical protein HC906_12120 [Bacteroidales bacterium]|nr:hypothetical protein [Bacteroidales bacterium]